MTSYWTTYGNLRAGYWVDVMGVSLRVVLASVQGDQVTAVLEDRTGRQEPFRRAASTSVRVIRTS